MNEVNKDFRAAQTRMAGDIVMSTSGAVTLYKGRPMPERMFPYGYETAKN